MTREKNRHNKRKSKNHQKDSISARKFNMNAQFDETWKFSVIFFFSSILRIFFPEIFANIDWSQKVIELNTENINKSQKKSGGFKKRIADLAFGVSLKSFNLRVIIHIDIQASKQNGFSTRVTEYNKNLASQHGRRVISLVIFVDKNLNWEPNKSIDVLLGDEQTHVYQTLKVAKERERTKQLIADNEAVGWVFLAHFVSRDTESNPKLRLEEKVRWTYELSNSKISEMEDKRAIFLIFDGLLRLPIDLQNQFYERTKNLRGNKDMELITQSIVDFNRKGRKEGRKEGEQKGLLEGLELALTLKYSEKATPLLAILPKVKKLETLKTIKEAIRDGKSLQQLIDLAKE